MLYETSGYISDPRVSPDGKRVAFADHQWWLDDRGWIKLVEEDGPVTTLSQEFATVQGATWTRDGSQIVFSASEEGTELVPMSVSVREALVQPFLGVSNSTTVLDLDGQERLLVLSSIETYGVVAHPAGSAEDVDLTWIDLCWNPVVVDNERIAFSHGRLRTNYSVVMRKTDSSPLTTLGDGNVESLSPDGAWLAAQIAAPPGVALYPTGPGTARQLDPGPIVQFHNTYWYPDSEHVFIIGNEAGGPARCFRQSISGGAPEPLEITGAESFSLLTRDGRAVLAQDSGLKWSLYPLAGGAPRAMPGIRAADEIWAWDPDGSAAYVSELRQIPWTLIRVDLATQERRPDVTIGPAREPGLLRITLNDPVFDVDGTYAYGFAKSLSRLLVVEDARW